MSTNRNTKGRTAPKKASKKAVKKPTKAQREMERREALLTEYFRSISEQTSAILKQGEKLDQIQRDIDLLKSGSIFMQEVEQQRAQPNITVWDAGQPEEPKAEPWVPKVGMHVVFLDDTWQAGVHKGAIEVESGPDCDGHWKTIAIRDYERGIYFPASSARPATPEEIAAHERSEKLKKLVRGCRVDTPDGEGIYLGRSQYDDAYHIVLLDTTGPHNCNRYTLDQLTPLT